MRPFLRTRADGSHRAAWQAPTGEYGSVQPGNPDTSPVEAYPDGSNPARLPPYLLTGGRTKPVIADLPVEAQLTTTSIGLAGADAYAFESREILGLCLHSMAVAEVAARTRLQLGVVRVLVGDLVASGHLEVGQPEVAPHRNVELMERVIRGLQAIG